MTTATAATKSFSDLGVEDQLADALADAGITSPFPIQELTLPLALAGADIIGQARTGTGKTLAFGIPLLQGIDTATARTQALVVVPTRELCVQVRNDLAKTGERKQVEVVAAYGGKALDPQAEAVAAGAPVVVGTPGRLLDLWRRGALTLSDVRALVLDEADEMLDLGFLGDVEQLIQACAPERQTLLFSATMPAAVVALARRYMRKPTFLRAEVEEITVAPQTRQYFFSCHRMDKPAVLARILQTPKRGLCVVFTRTKRMADVLGEELRERGLNAAVIHSDLRQDARERALQRFRHGTVDVLVATEVAARGLDVADVTHVVNYDCPEDEKMYLHRIGRTGRAGASGVAVTLAIWNELARLEVIKKALDIDQETVEVFSTSPILDELFDLPKRERGSRPQAQPEQARQETPRPASREARPQEAGAPRRNRGRQRAPKGTAEHGSDHAQDAATEPAEQAAERGEADAQPGGSETTTAPTGPGGRQRRRRTIRAGETAAATPDKGGDKGGEQQPAQTPTDDRDDDEAKGSTRAGDATRQRRRRRVVAPAERTGPRPETLERVDAEQQTVPTADREQQRTRSERPAKRSSGRRTRGRPSGELRQGQPQRTGTPASNRTPTRAPTRTPTRAPGPAATPAQVLPGDVDAARGAGKPTLYRRLRVEHAP